MWENLLAQHPLGLQKALSNFLGTDSPCTAIPNPIIIMRSPPNTYSGLEVPCCCYKGITMDMPAGRQQFAPQHHISGLRSSIVLWVWCWWGVASPAACCLLLLAVLGLAGGGGGGGGRGSPPPGAGGGGGRCPPGAGRRKGHQLATTTTAKQK